MDILNTYWFGKDQIESMIRSNESIYPSLIEDNIKIRKIASDAKISDLLKLHGIDVNAALVSSCRSDARNCGRCAFWEFVRKNNISVNDSFE